MIADPQSKVSLDAGPFYTRPPLRVVGEVLDWEGHFPEVLQNMRNHLDELRRLGIEAIND
jgi:rifampin ADP-ribosylating transferase